MDTSKLTSMFKGREAAKPGDQAAPLPEPSMPPDVPAPESTTPEADPVATAPEPAPAAPDTALPPPARPSRPVAGERATIAAAAAWMKAAARRASVSAKPLAAAAALLLALGAGYGLGTVGRPADGQAVAAASARWTEAMADLRQANGEVLRLASEVKGVKATLDGLKGEREKLRDLMARQERAGQEQTTRLGRLGEQIDRIEKTQRDPNRLAALTERLDRIEKGLSGPTHAPTPPPKPVAAASAPVDVAQTGSIGESRTAKPEAARPERAEVAAKPEVDPRKTQVEGFFVRDYDDGFALVETRVGRLVDVAVGYTVPGVGRVEAIERRGRQWVVVTPKGYIAER